ERFQPLLDRYLPFIFAVARRQLGNDSEAEEATRAVFLALAHRARKLPRKTFLPEWLFRATRLATAKLKSDRRRSRASILESQAAGDPSGENDFWPRLAPLLDKALDRLPSKQG